MSILVKDMSKPKKCLDCPMCNSNDDCVLQDGRFDTWEEQIAGCPIVEAPKYVDEIEEEYKKACALPYIIKPLAKALYDTWKKYDGSADVVRIPEGGGKS